MTAEMDTIKLRFTEQELLARRRYIGGSDATEMRLRYYAHMCRDEHTEIGHNDSGDDERCPVCQERARAELLREALQTEMKIYQVSLYEALDGSRGFHWFASRREAEKCRREWLSHHSDDETASAAITLVEITPTKAGILAALNRFAEHPDNG